MTQSVGNPNLIRTLVLVSAFVLLATSTNVLCATVEEAAAQKVQELYPDLLIADSPFTRAFVAEKERQQKINPVFFANPEWPLVIAKSLLPEPIQLRYQVSQALENGAVVILASGEKVYIDGIDATDGASGTVKAFGAGSFGGQTVGAGYRKYKAYATSASVALLARAPQYLEEIQKRKRVNDQDAKQEHDSVSGTGFFIHPSGYLLTNHHVIEGAERITVRTVTGDFVAEVIQSDHANDLAVLKVKGSFPALRLGNSKKVRLGDHVMTMGYPNIQAQGVAPKLTDGAVNSLSGIRDDPRFFQISVPIQPGNSGGPLVDDQGEVIGVTTAQLNPIKMFKDSGSLPQNVNYALKASYAQLLLDSIAKLPGQAPDAPLTDRAGVIDRMKDATVLVHASR